MPLYANRPLEPQMPQAKGGRRNLSRASYNKDKKAYLLQKL